MTETGAKNQPHVLITGASGGLGCALARNYARKGWRLSLMGRDEKRLSQTASFCREAGAVQVRQYIQDMRDLDGVRNALAAIDGDAPVDLLLLNAGVSSGVLPNGGAEPIEDLRRVMDVNATSTIVAAAFMADRMMLRQKGRIAMVSSLAAFYPLPSSPGYSAAKAAISVYGRALGGHLAGSGVKISVIYPGYVETAMSKRLKGQKPFCISAEAAARIIAERLEAGAACIVFPKILAFGMQLLHFLPRPVADFFAARFSFTIEPDDESPLSAKGRD